MDIKRFREIRSWEKFQEVSRKELSEKEKKQLEKFMNTAQNMKGKGEAEALKELTRMAKDNKAAAGITNEQLNQFAEALTPMLDEGQKQRLAQIMRMLKE